MIGSHYDKLSNWWLTTSCTYCFTPPFINSVCAPVSGWKAVDIFCSITKWMHNIPLNTDANWSPRSETIVAGSPCSCTTTLKIDSANLWALIIIKQGMKCIIVEVQSTTTKIPSILSPFVNLPTQSIEIWSQDFPSTDNGHKYGNMDWGVLGDLWQLWQIHMYWYPW